MSLGLLGRRLGFGLSIAVLLFVAVLALVPAGTEQTVWEQTVHGARALTIVVFPAAIISAVTGIALGLMSVRVGGIWDRLVSRSIEILGGFPSILIIPILRTLAPDAPMYVSVLALAVVRVPESVRSVRADAARFLFSDAYVALHALGASRLRSFFMHMLPGSIGGWASALVANVGVLAGIEAAMAFVGLGATSASWGTQLGVAAKSSNVFDAAVAGTALVVFLIAAFYLTSTLRRRQAQQGSKRRLSL